MRLFLAIQCFFAVLFARPVPTKALPPPPEESPEEKQARERQAAELKAAQQELESAKASAEGLREQKKSLEEQKNELLKAKEEAEEALDKVREKSQSTANTQAEQLKTLEGRFDDLLEAKGKAEEKLKAARDDGALAILAWLQREGRLIDFLMESIEEYEDEQIGAAVRAIHKGCRKVLDSGLQLEAILEGEEESPVVVPVGFDPVSIQLTGGVKGDPPFNGTLMHHGWRTKQVTVPVTETVDTHVLTPAEVEL